MLVLVLVTCMPYPHAMKDGDAITERIRNSKFPSTAHRRGPLPALPLLRAGWLGIGRPLLSRGGGGGGAAVREASVFTPIRNSSPAVHTTMPTLSTAQ